MKLIKINTDHYVVVDDSGKQVGWKLDTAYVKELIGEVDVEKKVSEYFKNYWTKEDGTEMSGDEITADMMTNMLMETSAYKAGYDQALEDNKEKKYTEAQMRECWRASVRFDRPYNEGYAPNLEEFIQSPQPKTSWEVEFADGKLKLTQKEKIEQLADDYANNKSSSDVFKNAHKNDFIQGYTECQKNIVEELKEWIEITLSAKSKLGASDSVIEALLGVKYKIESLNKQD